MEVTGYPSFIIYLILLVGIPLALLRPFKSFLMITFVLSSANSQSFTFTRTTLFGPYFNAHDACLLVAMIAVSPYILFQIKKVQFPDVAKWILAILLIGFVQSWFAMGWTYEALRALRWAVNLPVYIIIAATMIDSENKARSLLLALLAGSMLSAIEHIFFVQSAIKMQNLDSEEFHMFRTIAFRSPGVWFLIAGLVWMPKIKGIKLKLIFLAGILFTISVLLNQTRSIWISSIATLLVSALLFKRKKERRQTVLIPMTLIIMIAVANIILPFISKEIDPVKIIAKRVETFIDPDVRYYSTITRLQALEREISEWTKSSLVLGRGLSYYSLYPASTPPTAWGHLGHVTTLAQLGLIGLFIYSVYLPVKIINSSRKLWGGKSDSVKFLGLLSATTAIWCWICFLMSDSFLGQHAIEGIIFGAALRQANLRGLNTAFIRWPFIRKETSLMTNT